MAPYIFEECATPQGPRAKKLHDLAIAAGAVTATVSGAGSASAVSMSAFSLSGSLSASSRSVLDRSGRMSPLSSPVAQHRTLSERCSVRELPRRTRPKNILCFGDSLTAGFCNGGTRFTPYGPHLQEALHVKGVACKLNICGLSGHEARKMVAELNAPVARDIVGKLGKGLARILDEDGPLDLVIIMAGTNDFKPGVTFQSILDHIRRLHLACHARGVPTIALVPPCSDADVRKGISRLLRNWARTVPQVLAFIDPEDLVPRSMPGCWEPDTVHLSPLGSSTLGRRLAPQIGPILQEQPMSLCQSARDVFATPKRMGPSRTSRRASWMPPKVVSLSPPPVRTVGAVRRGGA